MKECRGLLLTGLYFTLLKKSSVLCLKSSIVRSSHPPTLSYFFIKSPVHKVKPHSATLYHSYLKLNCGSVQFTKITSVASLKLFLDTQTRAFSRNCFSIQLAHSLWSKLRLENREISHPALFEVILQDIRNADRDYDSLILLNNH